MRIRFKGPKRPRLLVRTANWVGDAVMMTPALGSLRRHFPRAEIVLLAKPWVAPVFEASPHVDRLLLYDEADRHRGTAGRFRLVRDLKALGCDGAVLFQNAFEAALIAALSGIPMRIGYPTDGRGFLLTHRCPLPPKRRKVHQVAYYLGILKGVGIPDRCRGLHLVVGEKGAKRARETLLRHGIQKTDTLVGINPGAAYGPAKKWPAHRFAGVGDRIQEAFGAKILIFGGPGDRPLGREIGMRMKRPAVNLAGKTDLSEAMALIRECALFITNDSGLMHVASALNVPLVAVFGSTDPETTGPWGYRGSLLKATMRCSPCLEPVCPKGHTACMAQISIDAVFEAARPWL